MAYLFDVVLKNLPKQVRQQGFEADHAYNPLTNDSHCRGKLYVDKFGREREEVYILHNSKWELTSIDIWDSVALKAYVLLPQEKKILLEEPIDLRSGHRPLGVGISSTALLVLPRHTLTQGKDLGVRQIEGVVCKGSMISLPADAERPGVAVECWHSELLSYIVSVTTISDNTPKNVFQLSNIRLIEPNQELFTPPADYTPVTLVPSKN